MHSKERVLTSLRHRTPDRIPLDINGHSSSGMSVQAYRNLRSYLGFRPSPLYIYDVVQQLAVVEDDMLDYFESDVIQLGCEYYKKPDYWQDWTLHDGTPCKIPKHVHVTVNASGAYELTDADGRQLGIQPKSCLYFEQTYFPLLDSEDETFSDLQPYFDQWMWGKAAKPPAPAGFDPDGLAVRRRDAQALRASTNRAIYANFGAKLFEPATQLFRMDHLMMELVLNPDRIHRFLDRLMMIELDKLSRYLEAVGEYIDILGIVGDDLGSQNGPLISQEMFCEFLKPRYTQLVGLVKTRYPHIKVCMHCCGGIYSLIPHLAEIGIDAVNPVQISCKDMQPEKLKADYGDIISFWGGGCDTGHVLCGSDTDAIRRHVAQNIETFGKNGGFVFQQVHNILANVPPQNIAAMYAAVKEFR